MKNDSEPQQIEPTIETTNNYIKTLIKFLYLSIYSVNYIKSVINLLTQI